MILIPFAHVRLLRFKHQYGFGHRIATPIIVDEMITSKPAPSETSYTNVVPKYGGMDIVTLRKAGRLDLDQINTLIAAAVDTWRLAERVKRLSLPLYQYDPNDLEHLQVIVAESEEAFMAGIAALEPANASECPRGHNAALLHGIYVDPLLHRHGIGTRLLRYMQVLASSRGFDGLLVKANPEAKTFFEARAFEKLPIEDHARDYPYRYWKSL